MKTRSLASRRRVDRLFLAASIVVGVYVFIDVLTRGVYAVIYSLASQNQSPIYLMTTGFNQLDFGSSLAQHFLVGMFVFVSAAAGAIVTGIIYGIYRWMKWRRIAKMSLL